MVRATGFLLFAIVTSTACAAGDGSGVATARPESAVDRPRTPENPDLPQEILESDLHRVVGDQVYVYNQTTGLYVVDASDPDAATVRAHAEVFGPAGELYAEDGQVLVVLERASLGCVAPEGTPAVYEGSEVIALRDRGDALEVESRTCIAGTVVATRLRGEVLCTQSRSTSRTTVPT